MKKLFIFLLLSASAFATTTVTGTIRTLGTTTVGSGTFVRFWLRGCGGNQPRVSGSGVIAPSQGGVYFFDIAANGSGVVSGTIYSTRDNAGTGNGDIECGGSNTAVWYGMQIFLAGKGGPEVAVVAKNGATLDISNVTPITTNPVVTAPNGDSTYLRVDGGNSPVTGPLTFNSSTLFKGTNTFAGAALLGNNYQSIDTFGDSITQGTGSSTFMAPGVKGFPVTWAGNGDYGTATYSNGPTAYAYLLSADYGNAGHNYGRGGDASTDMSWHVAIWAHPTLQYNPARTGMIGTNDNSLCGTNTNCQDTTSKAELFSAAQATIPDSLKTLATGCSTSGVWSAGDISGSLFTTANNASLTCTSTSSTAFTYIAYEKCDNTSSGTASVTVNGSPGSLEPNLSFFGLAASSIFFSNGASFATGSGQFSHCTLALARNAGNVGSNTTVITATNTGRVEIYWVGGPYVAPSTSYAPPLYVMGGVPFENANAGQPGVGQYNTIAKNAYNTLLADGNNVRLADVQTYMNSSADFTGGGGNGPSGAAWAASWNLPLHPGDSGHYHIYQAFRDQLQPVLSAPQVLNLWAGPYGLISSASSLGGRFGADGGLGGGQAQSILTISQTANDALVGLNFSTPGSHTVTIGQWGSGNGAGLPTVVGIDDNTLSYMTWNSNSSGDSCFLSAISYGSPNIATCVGATLYIQGGNTGSAYRVGINTTSPGIYNGLGAAGSEAILQIDSQAQAVFPTLVLQSNNASSAPIIKMINKQSSSGQRDWTFAHRSSPAQLALIQCPDNESACTDAMDVSNSSLLVTAVKGIATTPVAFGSLPACAAGTEGEMRAVTDSNTITWGATVAGSSTNHILAYCDGTNWTVAAK